MPDPGGVWCPHCGGRNVPDAEVCDYCGRSFDPHARSVDPRLIRVGFSAGLALLVGAALVLAFMNAARPVELLRPTPTADPLLPIARPTVPGPGAITVVAASSPRPAPVGFGAASLPATPTPEVRQLARVANTAGLGVFLRRDPSATAPPVTAIREGVIVAVLAGEEVTAARLWRQVEDGNGNRGWVLNTYLEFINPES